MEAALTPFECILSTFFYCFFGGFPSVVHSGLHAAGATVFAPKTRQMFTTSTSTPNSHENGKIEFARVSLHYSSSGSP